MRKGTKGKCLGCGVVVEEPGAVPHVRMCPSAGAGRLGKGYLLKIASTHEPTIYWMLVAISKDATLAALDEFLRNTWLECCAHLSLFTIGKSNFSSHAHGDFDESPMDTAVGTLFSLGLTFTYLYDFGASTHLTLEVVGLWEKCPLNQIALLMQNEPPSLRCKTCGKEGNSLCAHCFNPICQGCHGGHKCADSRFLPLVNSPRAGVCSYGLQESTDCEV